MSNGAACCALEICCPEPGRKAKLAAMIAKKTGVEESYCEQFLRWMEDEDLTFAPASFSAVIADIVDIVRKHGEPSA